MEPTAVGVHGWNLAGVHEPDSVVVVGIGNIGLLAILMAKAKGADNIIAIGKYALSRARRDWYCLANRAGLAEVWRLTQRRREAPV